MPDISGMNIWKKVLHSSLPKDDPRRGGGTSYLVCIEGVYYGSFSKDTADAFIAGAEAGYQRSKGDESAKDE